MHIFLIGVIFWACIVYIILKSIESIRPIDNEAIDNEATVPESVEPAVEPESIPESVEPKKTKKTKKKSAKKKKK